MMHSIRTQITAITIAAILISILAVFTASYLIIQSETDQSSVGMMNLIDQDTQKSLEKYFESIEQSVEVAANIAVEDLDSVFLVECGAVRAGGEENAQTPEQVAALDAYLVNYCEKIQAFFAGVADYTHGVTAYYYFINPEISRTERGFLYMKVGKTGFIRQASPDVEQLEPRETLNATWYEAAVRQGCPAWIGPYTSVSQDDTWIYSYFVPIYKAGMLIGVMGMDIPCDTLVARMNAIRVYETGYVCLLDAEGRVIYHPDLPIGSDLKELGVSLDTEIFRRDNSGDELIRYTAEGQDRQLSFSTLANGMTLVSIAPSDEINAAWIRLIHAISMIALAVIVVFAVVVLFAMGAITSPLIQLTSASRRLADDDYDVDLDYRGKNEIGTLTTSFKQMRDRIRQYVDDLNHQIYYDRLTDLPNMRYFFSLAQKTRDRMLEQGQNPVMVYFDMIGLRYYNRQCGFVKGDQVIVNFANILSKQFSDFCVCRFSGDHFAAVTDESRVEKDLEQILMACDTAADGRQLMIRVGIYPNRLEDVDVNIACDRAKAACDKGKSEIASTVNYFDEDMLKQGEVYRHIVNSIDQALAEGWVKVYYQPIIRTSDGKVCDEEALARWIDPVLGFLSPGDFIPALENSKLIYKLDLYVVDRVLEKMKQQTEAGFYLVPQSINLSRMDFESCDIVEEICRRVDAAGIDHSMMSIEITESVIGGDFAFMKTQVERFRQLGFPVWMDDFGSGYSSLDVLQQIHFDLIKFDMRFMERFEECEESKIILTELMTMAISLGTETICEGVEKKEQVEFLREIGCTRIQGYYYGKPLPFEGIVSLFENGTTLEFENPEETDYYASIGRINLYDISALSDDNDDSLSQYFNTLPMCIIEVRGNKLWFNRCNRSYREFLENTLGVTYDTEEIDSADELNGHLGPLFLKTLVKCGREGGRAIVDETVGEGTVIHSLIRRVAVNPVTGTAAVTVAVLAVSRVDENTGAPVDQGDDAPQYQAQEVSRISELKDAIVSLMDNMPCMTFTKHAKTGVYLACNQAFAEYAHKETPEGVVGLTDAQIFDAETAAHFVEDDQIALSMDEPFVFCEDVLDAVGNQRQFQTTKLKYYNFAGQLCVLGMCQDVTDMVRIRHENATTKEAYEKARSMGAVYARIAQALARSFMSLLYVNLDTDEYVEYLTDGANDTLVEARHGASFYDDCRNTATRCIYSEDVAKFQTLLTREGVLEAIERDGFFEMQYRMLVDGAPRYVSLKAVQVREQEKHAMIIGISDIDAQVKRQQDYERKLSSARNQANLDALTGVKNKASYEVMSAHLSKQIQHGQNVKYAIVLCRVSALSHINETEGRPAGNQQIRDVCDIICDTFKRSPVFRVTGDEFAVIAQGHDYDGIDELIAQLTEDSGRRGLAIATGMARYDGTESVASVFARAERLCETN